MARSFDLTADLVDCAPNCLPHRYGERRWLLWPAWEWRVRVPTRRLAGLNVFQRFVLALCATGVQQAGEVGKRLAIGKELAAYVIDELKSMGMLRPDGTPSHRGTRVLEEHEEPPELVSGAVYQDVQTGALWPRFILGIPRYVSAVGEMRGHTTKVDRGTPGKRSAPPCRVIWPEKTRIPSPPSASRVLQACRAWARHREAWQAAGGSPEMPWGGEPLEARSFGEGRVTVLGRRPEPVFLTTFVFLPEDPGESSLWQVCDPCGLGVSTAMRQRIEDLVQAGDRALEKELEALFKAAQLHGAHDAREERASRREAARARVLEQLGPVDCPEEIEGRLTQLEMSRLDEEALSQREGSAAWREHQRSRTAVVRRAWDTCEELLAWMVHTWTEPGITLRLGVSEVGNAPVLGKIAARLGFDNDPDLDPFGSLFLVTRGQVDGVMWHHNRDLPAMLAASLLDASAKADHPLHEAGRRIPGLVSFLSKLKRERDPVAHFGSYGEVGETDWMVAGVYEACRATLPLAAQARTTGVSPELEQDWAVTYAHHMRMRAVREIDMRLGALVRQHPDLRQALIELVRVAREVEQLDEARTSPEAMDALLRDLVMEGGRCVEGVLSVLARSAPLPTWAADLDHDALRGVLDERMDALGARTERVQAILSAKTRRIQTAARTGNGTLPSVAAAVVLATRDHDDHALHAILAAHPSFFDDLAHFADIRGHGDVAPTTSDALHASGEIIDLCKLVIQHAL